jgi:hypothetical protein
VESTLSNMNVRLDSITLHLKCSTTVNPAVHSRRSTENEIEPFNRIKSLTLNCDEIYTGDETTIKYIMKKFPKLNRLCWIDGLLFTANYIVKLSISTAVQFINYLCNIPHCSFQHLNTDSNTVEILYQVFSAPSSYKKNCLKLSLQDYGDQFNESSPITWIEFNHDGREPRHHERFISVFSKMTERENGSTRYNILKKVGRFVDDL